MPRPFIPCPQTAQIEIIYSMGSLVFENVIHLQSTQTYTKEMLVNARETIDTWDLNTWRNYRSSVYFLTRIRSKGLDDQGGALEEYQLPSARAGTLNASVPMSPHTTFALKMTTNQAGRSYRGRIYVVGLAAQALQGGAAQVTQSAADGMATAWDTLRVALAANNHQLSVVSFMKDGQWRSEGVVTKIERISYTDLNVDSQRRRLAGRGRT
jgi:hypothetical protein